MPAGRLVAYETGNDSVRNKAVHTGCQSDRPTDAYLAADSRRGPGHPMTDAWKRPATSGPS